MSQRYTSTRGKERSKTLRSSSVGRGVVAVANQSSKRLRAEDSSTKKGSNRGRKVSCNSYGSSKSRSGNDTSKRKQDGQQRGRLVLVRELPNVEEMDEEENDNVDADADENEEESEHENVIGINRMIDDLDDEEREDDVSDAEEGGGDDGVDGEDTSDYEDALPEMSATAGRGKNREPEELGGDSAQRRVYRDVGVTRRESSEIVRTMFDQAEVRETSKFMSAKDKVDQWELSSVRRVIREHLYPLAKIVFNSETELTLDGKICNVIFKHMRMDEAYNGYSDQQKKEYRKRLWVVWRDLVSRNLDQKRHNQKGIMRSLFWEWFEETEGNSETFPTCERLLRDDWFVADPLPGNVINAGLPENEQIEEEVLRNMLLRMGRTVVGAETWKTRGENCAGKFEDMLLITDEILIVWTVDGQYNGWCHDYHKDGGQRKRRGRGIGESDGSSSPAETSGDETHNKMVTCKQQPSLDVDDWLHCGRPLTGPWFIRTNMDSGFTKKHGGTTDFGKNRWNEWGKRIAARRRARTSEDTEVKQKYRSFCLAFQDAWRDMYQTKKRSNNALDGHDEVEMEAFNGIDWV